MKNLSLCVFFLFIGIISFSCASAPVNVAPNGRYIPADFTGVVHAGMSANPEEYELINYMGISWILQTFYWDRIEPEQGQWNFQGYDTFVDNAAANNVKVFGVLAYDVYWIHEDQSRHNAVSADQIHYYLDFVRETAEHFKGRVGAWCIWNEPNFHFWNGTDKEFVELSRQAADAIREVDSDVILLAGAFNRNVFGLPVSFIRRMFESGAMDKVDGIAFHPYELNASRAIRLYEQFRKIVDKYGFGDKIWITEMGYPTGGLYPTKVPENRFPEMIVKTYAYLAAAGARHVLWYQMFDPEQRSNNNSEHYFGLTRSLQDHTSKGAEAFRLCSLYMSDTTCYVLTKQDGLPGSMRAFWFKGSQRSALVIWNEGGTRNTNIALPGTNHLIHDIYTGSSAPILIDNAVRIGRDPVVITYNHSGEGRPVIR